MRVGPDTHHPDPAGLPPAGRVRVWDLGVRVFHWAVVATVATSAVTGFLLGKTTLAWHLAAGVVMAATIWWRVVWGVLGPTYARFASFLYSPAAVLAHLRHAGPRHRHLGHNPLGALMVFAMLLVLAALAMTGTAVLGGMLKQGPLRAVLTYAAGRQAEGIHKALAFLLMAMIAAHLAGVAFESWRGRENLVAAMLSGDKSAFPEAEPVAPALARRGLAWVITLAGALTASGAIVVLAARPSLGVPPQTLDPVFAEQCGACHLAFPPSLAPSSTWNGILADLQHHFTADASLSPEQVTHIRDYLDANAAERWDTLLSHLLRVPAADGSRRITDTPGWQRRHRRIDAAVFAAAPIYRRSNCAACHGDAATGLFAPQWIAIPAAVVP